MRHILLFLFFFTLSSTKSIRDTNYFDGIRDYEEELKIVRPENYKKSKPVDAKLLSEFEQDNIIQEEPGQIEYVEYIIDGDYDDGDSSDSDSYEKIFDAKEMARSISRQFDLLRQVMADYEDYGDYDSPDEDKQDFERRIKDEDEMKKVEDISPAELKRAENEAPRLAIDPPKPPVPDFSLDNLPETGSKDISVIPVIVKEMNQSRDVLNVPRNISVSIDISHLLLIGLAILLLFWIVRKAFSYYQRPNPVIVSPMEEGSVHKVPLE